MTKEKEGLKGVEKRTRNGMTNRGEEKGETESLSYSSQRIDRGIYHQTTPGSMWHTELNVVYVGLELSREFKVCGGWCEAVWRMVQLSEIHGPSSPRILIPVDCEISHQDERAYRVIGLAGKKIFSFSEFFLTACKLNAAFQCMC